MEKTEWLDKIADAIEVLAKDHDLSHEKHVFHFHPMYRAYLSKDSLVNIPRVFGNSTLRRWKMYWRKARKKNDFPETFEAYLPSDSVIFIRAEKLGLIALSSKKDAALKVFLNDYYTPLLDTEITALRAAEPLNFTPKVKGHGVTANNGYWSLTNFCSNERALGTLSNPEKYLLKNFFHLVMPSMTAYYQATSPEVLKLDDWMIEAAPSIEKHPSRIDLETLVVRIKEEAKKFQNVELLRSNIHFDLHAWNILLGEEKMNIIDWEGGFRGLVLLDFFDFSRKYIIANKILKARLGRFMRGKVASYPSVLRPAFKDFQEWSQAHYSITIPDGSEKLLIYIYALERTLLLFNARNIDRLRDERGFESFVFKNL